MTKIEELTAIKNEIETGPLANTLQLYRDSGMDGKISEKLTEENINTYGFISSDTIFRYCYLKDFIAVWKNRSDYKASKIMDDLALGGYDLATTEGYDRFIFITGYMLTTTYAPMAPRFLEADKQALLVLATVKTSRAKIIGCNCSIQNIAEALRGGLV